MTAQRVSLFVFCWCACLAAPAGSLAQNVVVPERALVAGGFVRYGRQTFPVDPVQRLIVLGHWQPPKPGQKVEGAGNAAWQETRSDGQGRFRHASLRGGYASITVESPSEQVMLLEASGHSMVHVNGVPRAGDPYGFGYVALPVELAAGRNELLFFCGRGELDGEAGAETT